jgi:hypothetical protein
MDFLQQITPLQWGIGLALLAFLAFVWRDKFAGLWPKSSPDVPVSSDPDVADLAAAKRLQARFEKHNCPEGLAAVKVCLQHFFDHAGGT